MEFPVFCALEFIFVSLQFFLLKAESELNGTSSNTTTNNGTTQLDNKLMKTDFKGIGLRAIYVITAVSGVVVAYLIIRAICSRSRKNRTRRYGMLSNDSRDGMEMRPLSEHEDDDDDDMTLFDMTNRKGKR